MIISDCSFINLKQNFSKFIFAFQSYIHFTDAYDFFKQFGKIESINDRSLLKNKCFDKLHYVLVQFKDANVAVDLIKRNRIIINCIEFEVKPLHTNFKPKDESDINITLSEDYMKPLSLSEMNIKSSTDQDVPDIDSPDNIIKALNDDCLHLIFEKINRLSDFNPITKVCKRFEKIAHKTFHLKIRQRIVRFSRKTFGDKFTLQQVEEFLHVFGSSIKEVALDEHYLRCLNITDASNTFLKMIYKYCKNLESLRLLITGLTYDTLAEIRPLLSKLKDLQIFLFEESHFGPFMEFVSACTQLKTLEIIGWNKFGFVLPTLKFSNLTDFNLIGPVMEIHEFLQQNSHIENLEVYYSLELCRLINNEMLNIRKLTLKNVPNDIDSTALTCLMRSELEISTELNWSMENIFRMKNITTLVLWPSNSFNESILIELIRNLCNLKKLTIHVGKYRDHIITTELLKKMLSHADQLIEFQIYPSFNSIYRFYERDYFEIIDIVKSRASHKKLNIKITCTYTLFDPHAESFSGHKTKFIYFDIDPKLLTVSLIYAYDVLSE